MLQRNRRETRVRKSWLLGGLASLALIAALLIGFMGYIGYFGGAVFVPVPATGRPAPAERGLAAVLLSGDMGFKIGMGPQIAERLAADGVPVIGVNSLAYFRIRRSPAENEALIAEATRRALALPGARRVVLIGQSFGADMLQAGLPALPRDLREKVAMVALIVPLDTIEYRASPAELINLAPSDAPALRTARQLGWVPVLCIHGEEETDSLCPLLTLPNVRRVALPGGHPMRRDTGRVHAVLKQAIDAAPVR